MNPVLFLDRDGVVNAFPGKGEYVKSWEEFQFLPNAKQALALLAKAGFETYIISNQGCVSRGLVSLQTLHEMTEKMIKAVEQDNGKLHGVFYCIHQTSDNCDCKKPKTALFYEAVRGKDLSFESVYFVGDSEEDILAGKALGCKTALVFSGRTQPEDIDALPVKPDLTAKDLLEAAQFIIAQKAAINVSLPKAQARS